MVHITSHVKCAPFSYRNRPPLWIPGCATAQEYLSLTFMSDGAHTSVSSR